MQSLGACKHGVPLQPQASVALCIVTKISAYVHCTYKHVAACVAHKDTIHYVHANACMN